MTLTDRDFSGSCDSCGRTAAVVTMAVRLVDGELLDASSYCRQHAIELLLQGDPGVAVDPAHLGAPTLDECYRDSCHCVPIQLFRCQLCSGHRIADVWITAGTTEDADDLDRGIHLCASCAVEGLRKQGAPPLLRADMRAAIRRAEAR